MPIFQPGRQMFKGEHKFAHALRGAADRSKYRKIAGAIEPPSDVGSAMRRGGEHAVGRATPLRLGLSAAVASVANTGFVKFRCMQGVRSLAANSR